MPVVPPVMITDLPGPQSWASKPSGSPRSSPLDMEPLLAFSVEVDTTLIYPSPRGPILGPAAAVPRHLQFRTSEGACRKRPSRAENDAMTEHAVVIAGGGPTGLMLAGELTLAGIGGVSVERRASQDLDGSRAGGLHSRTIEVLDQRGIAERFISQGQIHPNLWYSAIPLDLSDFASRHNYVLALWQADIERILGGWIDELGVPIRRSCEVVGF